MSTKAQALFEDIEQMDESIVAVGINSLHLDQGSSQQQPRSVSCRMNARYSIPDVWGRQARADATLEYKDELALKAVISNFEILSWCPVG